MIRAATPNPTEPARVRLPVSKTTSSQIIETVTDRLCSALARHKYFLLTFFSILYFGTTCYRASRKLFWFDELFTIYLSRLPDARSVWNALTHGVDFNPPLLYGLTHYSEAFFGKGELAARVPEILSFWIFCLCLFCFVSRRTSALGGFISMLFPLITTAYWYAYEARAHSLVLGFCGLALICWQAAADQSVRRALWILGLGGSVACATLSHCYGVLLLVPLMSGEMARSLRVRRLDWPVLLSIATGAAAMLVSWPLLRGFKSIYGTQSSLIAAFPATVGRLIGSYASHLTPAVTVLSVALVLLCLCWMGIPHPRLPSEHTHRFEEYEIVALLGFLAVPVFGYLLSKATGAPFVYRYTISCVGGFAGLLGIAAAKRPLVGIVVLCAIIVQIGADFAVFQKGSYLLEPTVSVPISTRRSDFNRRYAWISDVPDRTLPVVLLDDLDFLPTLYYKPPDLATRLVYVIWPHSDENGQGYIRLSRACPSAGNFSQLSEFLNSHRTFLAYGTRRNAGRLNELIRDGADVKVEQMGAEDFLMRVEYK